MALQTPWATLSKLAHEDWHLATPDGCALCQDPDVDRQPRFLDSTDLALCRLHVDQQLAMLLEWEREHPMGKHTRDCGCREVDEIV